MENEKEKLMLQIEKLEEAQVKTLVQQVNKIYEAIFGNGKRGLFSIVEEHSLILRIYNWCVCIVLGSSLGFIAIELIKIFKKI